MFSRFLIPRPAREPFVFDADRLRQLAREHHDAYRRADPFPHVVIDSFLPEPVAEETLKAFPAPSSDVWLDWRRRDTVHQPRKQGIGSAERLAGVPAFLQQVLFAFNSYPVVEFLEILTEISGLIPDPHYTGGGLHQILSGGKLAVHNDFNYHPSLRAFRRINLLLFLNKDWKDEYHGELELWQADMGECVHRIRPDFNRCVVFGTTADSLHGHPEPLRAPKGVARKSLALYYYTTEPGPGDEELRDTGWKNRPGETEM